VANRPAVKKLWAATAISVVIAVAVLPLPGATAEDPAGEWYAGDFHVHSTYSHDSYSGPQDDNTGPEEMYTLGWSVGEQGDIARSRGLDFVTITDHNDIRSQSDPAWDSEGLIWVPGYENSSPGHAQMLGATKIYDNGTSTLSDAERIAAELRADGGAFQINHPSDRNWEEKFGYALVPDTVEVWNTGPWAYQPPFPSASDNESSLRFYDRFLDAGHRVAVTGGSDNHWRSVTPVAGVGQPTTWVFSTTADVAGILAGVRAGRTTISDQPPALGGAFATITADEGSDGIFESMMGDKVLPGTPVRVSVTGADGGILRIIGNRSTILAEENISGDEFSYDLAVDPVLTWVRAEVYRPDADAEREQLSASCQVIDAFAAAFGQDDTTLCKNRLMVSALTSPIYFGLEPSPSPTP
jgi:hypothetical protein